MYSGNCSSNASSQVKKIPPWVVYIITLGYMHDGDHQIKILVSRPWGVALDLNTIAE